MSFSFILILYSIGMWLYYWFFNFWNIREKYEEAWLGSNKQWWQVPNSIKIHHSHWCKLWKLQEENGRGFEQSGRNETENSCVSSKGNRHGLHSAYFVMLTLFLTGTLLVLINIIIINFIFYLRWKLSAPICGGLRWPSV